MNTPKTMIGLLALGLLFGAGVAGAVGGTLGGTYGIDTDASAHVDYSGVLKAADAAKGAAESAAGSAKATADQNVAIAASAAVGTGNEAKATVGKTSSLAVKASTDMQKSFFADMADNIAAFGSWAQGIFVKPTLDAKHVEDMDAAAKLADDVQSHDGTLDVDYSQVLESTARADYNIPPPPTPKLGFLGEIKMAFEGILHLA
ncbi:MAG: hypothetical protein WDA16_05015 [Candidatus Thermoplasmatota archaeon]